MLTNRRCSTKPLSYTLQSILRNYKIAFISYTCCSQGISYSVSASSYYFSQNECLTWYTVLISIHLLTDEIIY